MRARDDGESAPAISRPACVEVNQAMQEFTGVNYNTGSRIRI